MPAKTPAPDLPVDAEQITGFLKGALQAARIAHLFVGRLLAQVRDRKLYADLGCADLESYARDRLQLGKTSLYHYLKVYDWVQEHHPEWLDPGPDTFVPDLNDLIGLIWIQKELEQPAITVARTANLNKLKAKAESGTLKKAELAKFRDRTRAPAADIRKQILARLRKLRDDSANADSIPREIVTGLDDLIALLQNSLSLPLHLDSVRSGRNSKVA